MTQDTLEIVQQHLNSLRELLNIPNVENEPLHNDHTHTLTNNNIQNCVQLLQNLITRTSEPKSTPQIARSLLNRVMNLSKAIIHTTQSFLSQQVVIFPERSQAYMYEGEAEIVFHFLLQDLEEEKFNHLNFLMQIVSGLSLCENYQVLFHLNRFALKYILNCTECSEYSEDHSILDVIHCRTKFETQVFHLGSGTYGHVYKIFNTKRQKMFAKKVFIDRESEYNKKEMEFYASQNHDNEEYIVSPSNILQPYVILPYLNGRTFKNEIEYQLTKNLRTDCSKHELRKMKNLIEMLKGLHAKGLFHRDVSFKNIMSHFVYSPSHSEDGHEYFSIIPLKETSGVLKVAYRLIDFGTVKPFPSSTSSGMTPHVGNEMTMAPEMYASEGEHSKNYNASADIFSLGCILFALVSGLFEIQFSGQASQSIGKYVKENARQTPIAQRVLNLLLQRSENLILKIPHSVRVLIVKMLHYDPQSRPTLDEALHIIEEALKEINP